MLVLSCRRGEAIHIADTVQVKVLDIRKGRAKLGLSSPTHLEKRTSVPLSCCDGKTDAQDTASVASPLSPQVRLFSGGNGRHVSCEVRDGLPKVHHKVRGHYVSRQGGPPRLVLERGRGDRIRINGTTDVVVLEIHAGQLKIAIESLPDDAGSNLRDGETAGRKALRLAGVGKTSEDRLEVCSEELLRHPWSAEHSDSGRN